MDIVFELDTLQLLQFFVATVLPLLVGLVTTRVTRPGTQAVLLLALSFVTSLLTELLASGQAGEVYDLGQGLFLGLTSFVVGVATHYGLWKPTGTTVKALNSGHTV